ncbi:DUF5677 domain-containing protein [Kitasatospora sp. NPDC101155]|uniref:DUF5677 domain-containing protein n=1 Tax=Kitasatospora sp. NPDC101155 TaxID=3364097 RepID=UPI0038186F31
MTNLTNDQNGAAISRAAALDLIKAADSILTTDLSVEAGKARIFGAIYSWWRLVCRTSEAVLLLTEQGFTAEVGPLMRNIFNHAYAIHWLADNGDAAIEALAAKDADDREKLCKKLEDTGWVRAAEFRAELDRQTAAQPTAPVRTPTEQALHGKLVHELRNVFDMLDHYGSPDLYPVYAHLSALSHTSGLTARLYLEQADDGTVQIRRTAIDLGAHADVVQVALSLLQVATVVSPMLSGDPLRAAIDQATADLGVAGVQLLPVRVK